MMKKVQQMRTMLPIGRSDESSVWTTSLRPGARLITLHDRRRPTRVARSPYFTGDPVFQPRSPASRKEAARETESPVYDYRLIQIGRIYKLCDSNLQHAARCDEHKSFMLRTLY